MARLSEAYIERTRASVVEFVRDALSDLAESSATIADLRERVEELAAERQSLAVRCDQLLADAATSRAKTAGLERDIETQREQIERQYACTSLAERERDAALAIAARFRGLFNHEGVRYCDSNRQKDICREYDRLYGQPAREPPPPAETRIVLWTAETRPRGVVLTRNNGTIGYCEHVIQTWGNSGVAINGRLIGWSELFNSWEWSRDGVNWEPCGTVEPAEGGE